MYSSVDDMVSRFGLAEMCRLTTPSGQALLSEPDPAVVSRALTEASAVVDSYLRRRYQTPITSDEPEITRAAAILARYDLAHGDDRQPSQQMIDERADVVSWLKGIRDGTILLDLDAVSSSEESQAVAQTRVEAWHTNARPAGWGGVG